MPKVSTKVISGTIAVVFTLAVALVWAQRLPRGTATYISAADVQAVANRSADKPANDTQIAVVGINNDEDRLAVGVAHRSKASLAGQASYEHTDITEVYYIVSGSGVLLTGGTIENVKPPSSGSPSGPTASGGKILNGVSRKVGPGDVIVIPPNTPHIFSSMDSDQVVYVLIRPDPHKVLPLMNLLGSEHT